MNKGKIDRILEVKEIPGICEYIEQYELAIISISSTNPTETKLIRAKLLTERFLIATFKANRSKIFGNELNENQSSFLVINIFGHPDFHKFLNELTIEFEEVSLIVKDNIEPENKERIKFVEEQTFFEELSKWDRRAFNFEHFHFFQNNSKRIFEIIASQTIEELEGIITLIKYFSPDGRDEIPIHIHFQKGGFLYACEVNAHKFKIPDVGYVFKNGAASFAEGAAIFITGAITVLPNNAKIEEELIFKWLKNELTQMHSEQDIWFSIGKFFYGTYGQEFDKASLCILVNGIKWKPLVHLNKNFLIEFKIEKALLKDLNSRQIFLIEIA